MMKPILSIRSSLILLVAVCLLPASFIAVGLFLYEYQLKKTRSLENSLITARTISALVDKHFSNVEATLHALGTSPHLSNRDFAGFYAQAKELVMMQDVANVVLTDAAGKQLLNTLRPFGVPLPDNGSKIRLHHFG